MSDPLDPDEKRWDQPLYDELHRLAQRALAKETPGHSLQPTLLVHDAYLRLQKQQNLNEDDRSMMLAAGANIIRRLLVDYARQRKSQKRGGKTGRGIPLHISVAEDANRIDVLELNDALEAFSKVMPRAAEVVELKFFGGMTGDEIANKLGISLRSVNNDWKFAKAWLYRELGSFSESENEDDDRS
ncbi:transcriptional regulator [Blastopirellula marina]|uniref:Transcriptional regulator n=1 Tax=Blastopirellula marina TaxID=124 RepID=A0A2S8F2N0_9BACT|nr:MULTISPECIES: ECF-type sigma factor [Pirellulaceae]PQO26400.1 transcriptional regulator [Blastopirellula marina]RCS44856.1 transcriptional regulator [Bremerella cremea]